MSQQDEDRLEEEVVEPSEQQEDDTPDAEGHAMMRDAGRASRPSDPEIHR